MLSELPDDIKRIFEKMDAAARAIKEERRKFQETEEYHKFEESLEQFCNDMDEIAESGDIIKIMEAEYDCYYVDLKIMENYEVKTLLISNRQSYFICGQALEYLKKLDAEEYKKFILSQALLDYAKRPRFDIFILLWVQLFKYIKIQKEYCYSLYDNYDYRKFYAARLKNLKVAIKLYRQWQNKLIAEIQ